MREVIKEARNVEEAIDAGCRELGVERDAIEFEIITLPKRGFLGLKNTPAKVRVYLEEPEPVKPEPKPEPRRMEPPARPRPERPQPPRPAAPRPPEKREAPVQPPRQKAPDKPPMAEKPVMKPAERPVEKPAERPAEKPAEIPAERPIQGRELIYVSAEETTGKAKTAVNYIGGILEKMGVNANLQVAKTESGIVVRLFGDGLGVIIGRRGETLDALQYLAGLAANREEGDYMRVTIDSGNYREKRERTLEQLAKKLSGTALRYGRSSTLEPMNPYERRIIHATVSRIEGVTSTSIGEEPNRRVVISPVNPRPQPPRPRSGGPRRPPVRRDGSRPEGRGPAGAGSRYPTGGRRDFRENREPRMPAGEPVKPTSTEIDKQYAQQLEPPVFQKNEPAVQREETKGASRQKLPDEGSDLPLYGKIEL